MSEFATESRSSVTIDGTAKGDVVPKIKAYEGVSQDEMTRLADVAITTMLYASAAGGRGGAT